MVLSRMNATPSPSRMAPRTMKSQPTPVPVTDSMIPVASAIAPSGVAIQPRMRTSFRPRAVAASLKVMALVCAAACRRASSLPRW